MADGLWGLFGGLLDTYNNERNIAFQRWANNQNIDFMRETNEQNESLMRESWAREDNAVQRRTADLRAAGLNPVLAAGGGASAGSPIQLKAPEVQAPHSELQGIAAGLAMQNAATDIQAKKASIAQTRAQTKVTEKQQESLDLDNRLKSGTLEPRIQEAVTAAKVALETASPRIAMSKSEAERAAQEADAATVYYYNRAWEMEGREKIAQYKALAEKVISQVVYDYAGPQANANLVRTQAQAAAAAVAANIKEIDYEALKRMKLSPAGWERLMDVFKTVFQGIGAVSGALKK